MVNNKVNITNSVNNFSPFFYSASQEDIKLSKAVIIIMYCWVSRYVDIISITLITKKWIKTQGDKISILITNISEVDSDKWGCMW